MKRQKMDKDKINPGAVITEVGNSEKAKKVSFRNFKPVTDYKKCIKCAKCWMNCPDIAFRQNQKGFFENIERFCKGCGICEKICPVKAIKMEEIKNE
jgi:2-oxoacid:acceptor oxidoreductase delta subunit (pyruvate/2-ketoisovalerate family)